VLNPLKKSDLHPTDSDFSPIYLPPDDIVDEDEDDLFNTDDNSFYSMEELDEKINTLLSGKNNFNLVTDDENKNILRYKPILSENLKDEEKIQKNNNTNATIVATIPKSKPILKSKPSSSVRHSQRIKEPHVVEELNYDQPEENVNYQDSSSDDPFGFSKAEKIYKTKQQQLKQNGPHTPVRPLRYYTNSSMYSLDNLMLLFLL